MISNAISIFQYNLTDLTAIPMILCNHVIETVLFNEVFSEAQGLTESTKSNGKSAIFLVILVRFVVFFIFINSCLISLLARGY